MMSRISQPSLLLACILLVATGCEQTPAPVQEIESAWYRKMDNPNHEFVTYPDYLYQPVLPAFKDEAIAALGQTPLLQLSTAEAERYAGTELHMPMELRPFLIYGLAREGGKSIVFYADRALWVDNINGSGGNETVTETPLVIFIDEVPPDVYVTAGQSKTLHPIEPR